MGLAQERESAFADTRFPATISGQLLHSAGGDVCDGPYIGFVMKDGGSERRRGRAVRPKDGCGLLLTLLANVPRL
jgi:hypothetical protein